MLDIWYSALHCGAAGGGQAWIKAFSLSKSTFFPQGYLLSMAVLFWEGRTRLGSCVDTEGTSRG